MTGELLAAFDVASRLASALEVAGVPYAIGGAIALGAWSDPRGTHDVDRVYIRRWLVEMMGPDDERVVAWDRITASVGT